MDDPDLTTPGGRLRYARELRDLTQDELGDLVSIDRNSVWRHEAKSTISKRLATRYAEALQISEGWLMYRDGPDPGVRLGDALEAYFDSDLGRSCKNPVRDMLRRVPYAALGVHRPDIRTIERIRDLIEKNLEDEAKRVDGSSYRAGSAA